MIENNDSSKESKESEKNGNGLNVIDIIWDLFKSTKLAIFILIFISITSVIGTIIPQSPNKQQLRMYSEGTRQMLESLGLFDMYHSKWFVGALALLCINLLICSIDRIPRTMKQIRDEKPAPSSGNPEKMKLGAGFDINTAHETATEQVRAFLKKTGGRIIQEQEKSGDSHFFMLNRGRYSRLGVYILHFSIILIVLGSLGGNIFGFHGRLWVLEGSSTDHFARQGAHQEKSPLGFTVVCEQFTFELHPETGGPGEFTSKLAILDGDAEFVQHAIHQYLDGNADRISTKVGQFFEKVVLMVNHPFYHEGTGLFQSSYELHNVQSVTVSVRKAGGGEELGTVVLYAEGAPVDAPGGGKLKLTGAYPNPQTQTIVGAELELDKGEKGKFKIEVHEGHTHAVSAGLVVVEIIVSKIAGDEEVARLKISKGEEATLPTGEILRLIEYIPNFEMEPHGNMGKMVAIDFIKDDTTQRRKLFSNFPAFDKMNASTDIYLKIGNVENVATGEDAGDLEYSLVDADGLYATILDVNYDPGVWLVWVGCSAMFVGLWMAFFWSHRKVWIKVAPGRISIGGVANRNIQGFEIQFPKLVEKLKKTVNS